MQWVRRGWCLVEQGSESVTDRACLGVSVAPLVGVDAQGGIGFSVTESVLDVGDAAAKVDEH
jgi:hypothetical protein